MEFDLNNEGEIGEYWEEGGEGGGNTLRLPHGHASTCHAPPVLYASTVHDIALTIS